MVCFGLVYVHSRPGLTEGKWAWEFKLEEDNMNNEMTCMGAAVLPMTTASYSKSKNMWMYRGYNGGTYARGTEGALFPKFHPGDVIRMTLDLTEVNLV